MCMYICNTKVPNSRVLHMSCFSPILHSKEQWECVNSLTALKKNKPECLNILYTVGFSYVIYALYAHTARVEISIQGSKKLIARKRGRDVCKHGYTFKLRNIIIS